MVLDNEEDEFARIGPFEVLSPMTMPMSLDTHGLNNRGEETTKAYLGVYRPLGASRSGWVTVRRSIKGEPLSMLAHTWLDPFPAPNQRLVVEIGVAEQERFVVSLDGVMYPAYALRLWRDESNRVHTQMKVLWKPADLAWLDEPVVSQEHDAPSELSQETPPAKKRSSRRVYTTLAELKAAYDSGELNPNKHRLTLDNDNSTVYRGTTCVYRGPGYEIREEALTLLGIPWERA